MARPTKDKQLIRHVFLSDFQGSNVNKSLLHTIYAFLTDFAPDYVHLIGDIVDFEALSSFIKDPNKTSSVQNEIDIANDILDNICRVVRKQTKQTHILWYDGNHEDRWKTKIFKQAPELWNIKVNGEEIFRVEYLFQLKKRDIVYLPYLDDTQIFHNQFVVIHGKAAGLNAGRKHMQDYFMSGISGHTHKLELIWHKGLSDSYWWMQTGCLCKERPDQKWLDHHDFQNGFGVMLYDQENKMCYPEVIPILNNSFAYDGKIYR